MRFHAVATLLTVAWITTGCALPPEGLARTKAGDGPTVIFEFDRRPLPELPFPNDIATRPDPSSPTGLRINASLIASTHLEQVARRKIDELSGFGIYQPISVRFDEPLDLDVIFSRHRDHRSGDGPDYDFSNDAVYLIDVTPGSPTYLEPIPLDFGEGNFPQLLRTPNQYWEHDPKTITAGLAIESYAEDLNGNRRLEPEEDIDLDGVLDAPNVHPMQDGDPDLDIDRDLVSFWERETNTLIFKPIIPLREKTTYAVVLTKRLRGQDGEPVRSPFRYVNHATQTDAIRPALDALAEYDLSVDDVAFAWSYTTQDVTGDMVKLRNGLYGEGELAWLLEDNPPELASLFRMQDPVLPDTGGPPDNPYLLPQERLRPLIGPLAEMAFGGFGVGGTDLLVRNHDFYAYHVSGIIKSPRLLDLQEEGNLDERAWPDLSDPTLRERIVYDDLQFWCVVPKPQYVDASKPIPVLLYAHGYTSNKIEQLGLGLHAKFGIAGCGMDAVAHGLSVGASTDAARNLLALYGVEAAADALLYGRAEDVDFDGQVDVGANMFTGYIFRTRDNLRQTLLDWLTLVRFVRAFGTKDMIDVDGDGVVETLGDFDADGVIDFGGPDAEFFASGTSLGGLVSSMLSAIEPRVAAAAPIAGGAGLVDLTIRSEQGGVVEAIGLRLLGPALVGEPTADGAGLRIYQLFVNSNKDERRDIAVVDGVQPDDVVMVTNLRSGEARCGRVMPDAPPLGYETFEGWEAHDNCSPNSDGRCRVCADGTGGSYACDLARTFRIGIAADKGDPLRLEIFAGGLADVEIVGDERDCFMPDDVEVRATVDTFELPVQYRDQQWNPGAELVALEDGFGFQRGTPMLRRFTAISAMAIEKADPAAYAVHYSRDPLTFVEDGEEFQKAPTHVLNVTTVGDPNVPVNTGVAIAKVAGFIELFEPDPRYGKTPNRVIIDQGVQQGIPWLQTRGPEWGPVLVDVDNLSASSNTTPMDLDGSNDDLVAPRLRPPLRLVIETPGAKQGFSGIVFPLLDEFRGAHGFPPPGMTQPFDMGQYMEHMIGLYFRSRGTQVRYDTCMAELEGCEDIPAPPPEP